MKGKKKRANLIVIELIYQKDSTKHPPHPFFAYNIKHDSKCLEVEVEDIFIKEIKIIINEQKSSANCFGFLAFLKIIIIQFIGKKGKENVTVRKL